MAAFDDNLNKVRPILYRMNFVEDVGYFIRNFTKVYVQPDSIYVGHTFNSGKVKIDISDLKLWISYFDRI